MKIAGMKVELPSGWKVARCEEIIDVRDGTHDTPKYISSGYPLVTSKNLKSEGIDFSTVSYISEKDHFEISKRSKVDRGDILFAMIGTIGNPVIVNIDTAFSIKNVALFKFFESSIDARYFKYLLETPIITRQLDSEQRGGTQKFVSLKVLRNMLIPYPSPEEQRRIATILDKADAVRRKRKEAIALTEELLRSAFLEMFGDPVTNPKGWEVKPLIQLIDPKRPITYGILKPGPDIPSGIPYVRVVEMKNSTVDSSIVRRTTPEIAKQYSRSTLISGDLLLSIRGHVGRLAITPSDLNGANITQDTARLAVGNLLTTEFLFALLDSYQMQNWMKQRIKGAGVQGINLGDVKEIPTPIPSMLLQEKFSAIFRRIRIQQERDRDREYNMDNLFNSLLQRAFRGEL